MGIMEGRWIASEGVRDRRGFLPLGSRVDLPLVFEGWLKKIDGRTWVKGRACQ